METLMRTFEVDDDLSLLVWQLAKPKPFENLSFSAALRRVLQGAVPSASTSTPEDPIDAIFRVSTATARAEPKKAPTPSPVEWASNVPELKSRKGLNTWKAICDLLKIDTAGDSARRKLKNWVKLHRPMWPTVPDID
jgi:hypothetical protein